MASQGALEAGEPRVVLGTLCSEAVEYLEEAAMEARQYPLQESQRVVPVVVEGVVAGQGSSPQWHCLFGKWSKFCEARTRYRLCSSDIPTPHRQRSKRCAT